MKILVGVDIADTFQPSLDLFRRLQFPNQEWFFASAVPLATIYPGDGYVGVNPGEEARRYMKESARAALDTAIDEVKDKKAAEFLLDGDATASLINFADEHKVDLIVVGSGELKGGLLWRIGSVSRALTYGAKQSLLVTKGPIEQGKKIHAVFATDHSPYAERAAEQLIKWAPKGLERIDIVTAYDMKPKTLEKLREETEVDVKFEDWLCKELTKKSEALALEFKKIAQYVNVRVMKGEVNDVIHRSMILTRADLLILGAQGHGFIERLMIGSVSLHQVVAESHPVLVIRLPSS